MQHPAPALAPDPQDPQAGSPGRFTHHSLSRSRSPLGRALCSHMPTPLTQSLPQCVSVEATVLICGRNQGAAGQGGFVGRFCDCF